MRSSRFADAERCLQQASTGLYLEKLFERFSASPLVKGRRRAPDGAA